MLSRYLFPSSFFLLFDIFFLDFHESLQHSKVFRDEFWRVLFEDFLVEFHFVVVVGLDLKLSIRKLFYCELKLFFFRKVEEHHFEKQKRVGILVAAISASEGFLRLL